MNSERHLVERGLIGTLESGAHVTLQSLNHPSNEALLRKVAKEGRFSGEIDQTDLFRATWALVSRGLVYLDMGQSVGFWALRLTDKGRAVAENNEPNPDDPSEYMERLLKAVPSTPATVKMYLDEALHAYAEGCFLSSAVMLGVAAEATMLDLAAAYVKWAGVRAKGFQDILENPRTFYVFKMKEFRKRLPAESQHFPEEIRDSLDLEILPVLQLIRLTRNDAGHPTAKKIDKETCYSHLVIYAAAHKKIHALAAFFLK